jgi:hypothetical protein
MSKTTHTPGPWDSGGTLEIVAGKWGDDVPTVAVARCDQPRGLDGYANARLIAAAPELLDTLSAMWIAFQDLPTDYIENHNDRREVMKRAKVLINEATRGGQ